MFNVRLKKVRFTKSVLAISLVALILLEATANAHVLRRDRREIIDSDSGHAHDGIVSPAVAPTSSATTSSVEVPIDRVHLLESSNENNKSSGGRVGVHDISNTNSSTTSKYSQNDIIISNLNGSTTSLPSSTTDVANAIATDILDELHPEYQHEYDGAKHNQRSILAATLVVTTATPIASTASVTTATSASIISNRAAHRPKDDPKVVHETREIVSDKRAKFLVDTSTDFAATTTPSWGDLKKVGEVNHNNVTFSKAADADIAVVKLESKSVDGQSKPSTNSENGSTESIGNAGVVAAESHEHMFETKLNRNSSRIDDSVHQDISVNVLSATRATTSTTTISPITTIRSTTPKLILPQTTEREHSAATTLMQFHDEIELHLLSTTTEEQLTTTTDHPPTDTTLIDDSIATINTLKPNETESATEKRIGHNEKYAQAQPETTEMVTRPTETPTEPTTTEAYTETITTIQTIAPIARTSTKQPHHVALKPTTEIGARMDPDRQNENQVQRQSENSINAVATTEHGNDIETTEKVETKSTTILDTSTLSTTVKTTATTTTTMSTLSSTTSTTTSTTTEASVSEDIPNQTGIGDGLRPDTEETPDVNAMIAITISVVSVVTLILLVGFLIVMRKRQKQLSYAQRCRPLGLDDAYSLDNISVYNSVRRKSAMRTSKRAYGNAAFDDPALKNNLLTISQLAAFVQRRTSIYEEFRDVPLVTARIDEVPTGCEDKNRYANVVPLPESRVHLQQLDDDETTEYINANYVKGPKDTSHYYIACQAPMENTIIDFWRMIWEQNSRVVIMATDLIENGIEKCAEYLPPSFVIDNHVTFGDFTITLKNREVRDKYAVSTMHLKNMQTKTWREITHLWYQWPETGTPSDETSIIAMLLEARSYLKMAAPEQSAAGTTNSTTADDDKLKSDDLDMKIANGNSDKSKSLLRIQGPLTVHCSPGTGRTGTIIACDIAIRTLEQPTRSVDIPQIVYCVRRGRASAVQTREQYEFIYKVTQMYATKLTGLNNEN